jgi:hypothetical protein
VSYDYGVSWAPRSPSKTWNDIACSADGSLFAAPAGGANEYIYLAKPTPGPDSTTLSSGYIMGGQQTAVELLYVGDGKFIPLSSSGAIFSF